MAKLKYARMGEIKQLDKVKGYLYPSRNKIKSPEDIYLQVFEPIGVGKADSFVLYQSPSAEYNQNKSLDVNKNNKIERGELLKRYYKLYEEGKKNIREGSGSSGTAAPSGEVAGAAVHTGEWHDPVDNPICTLYMQSGGNGEAGKHWGLFGNTRNGDKHQGLDLFAKTGTNIYACVDSTVYNIQWHGGYGNIICIKVKNPKAFLARRFDYKLQCKNAGEMTHGTLWKEDGDILLFYAHLNSVKNFKYGDEVKAGQVLGTTGRSGVSAGTCAPHLHFEIFSYYKKPSGHTYNINPAFFVNYKGFNEQSDEEKEMQEREMKGGKVIQYKGEMDLKKAWMLGWKR